MKNLSALKNELIFEYASGISSLTKSFMASTYLFLNSEKKTEYTQYENYCGEELKQATKIQPVNLRPEDCFKEINNNKKNVFNSPINDFIKNLQNLKWNKVFTGFYEHSIKLSDKESAKLIKMDPGAKVPLHSHNGKEYILVLEGSFNDEYGQYSKGDLQINDFKIKHTPIACKENGCICLTITEKDLVFYGPFSPILNILTFIKTLIFKS